MTAQWQLDDLHFAFAFYMYVCMYVCMYNKHNYELCDVHDNQLYTYTALFLIRLQS